MNERMRVARDTTTSRSRRPPKSLCMEVFVRNDRHIDLAGDTGILSSRASSKMQDNEGHRLWRHNSAIFENEIKNSTSSIVRTRSQVREEMLLGSDRGQLAQRGHVNDVSGSIGPGPLLFEDVAREVSKSFSPAGKGGQLNSFVYKNYSLSGRRTMSLPTRKERLSHGHQCDVHTPKESASTSGRSISFIKSPPTRRIPSIVSEEFCVYDFDMEAERHSKSALFIQAGHTLVTVVAAVFTVCTCIGFLTSGSSLGRRGGSDLLSNASDLLGRDGTTFAHCSRIFIGGCSLVGLLAAGFAVVAGARMTDGLRPWRRPRSTVCTHCETVQESRNRIEEADERVQRAHRAKQQFMAYVFHNIRVPFNAIVLGLGHMRASGAGDGLLGNTWDDSDLVQMMLDCAETMTSVLNDVTDMGQWEVGQMELHKDEFDILAVLKFLSWGLKDLLEQKQISFTMKVDDMASQLLSLHHVIGDKQRVVQTLGNFLSNAIKFTPAGGNLELSVECNEVVESKELSFARHHSSSSPGPVEDCLLGAAGLSILTTTQNSLLGKRTEGKLASVRISVKDTGIGISVDDQAKLFEPYSLVTSGWVQKAGVSGLGLSMAKRFVEQAGGSIGVDSTEGKGSTFFFSIPFPLMPCIPGGDREFSRAASGISMSAETSPQESLPLMRGRSFVRKEDLKEGMKKSTVKVEDVTHQERNCKRKVLLVEDTRINRIILRKVLQNLNLQCDEAENGLIAVDLHKQGKAYDLILMDKEMPVMDGHEATRQLRMMGVKTPIVALTGNALQSDRELFFEAGVDDFQTKPLSRDKLVQLLARYGVESSRSKVV